MFSINIFNSILLCSFVCFPITGGGGGGAGGEAEEEEKEEEPEEEEADIGGGMDMFGGDEGGDY